MSCAALVACACFSAETTDRYSVSISTPKAISPEERVVSFEVEVAASAIRSISHLPVGWHVVIDNDASWNTKITATATVGAASLTLHDLNSLQFVIDKNEFGDLKFRVTGAVSVTKDYATERLIRLDMRDFKIGHER